MNSLPLDAGTGAPGSTQQFPARRLGSQVLFVLCGNAFTLLVGFPLQVYVSRVLGAGGLGVFGLLDGLQQTIAGLLSLGVGQTFLRFIPSHLEMKEYGNVRRLLRLAGGILLAAGGLASVIWLLAIPLMRSVWPSLDGYGWVAAVMGLLVPIGLLNFAAQQALRGFHEVRYMVTGSSFVQLLVKAALTVGAFTLGMALDGYVIAILIANIISLAWMGRGLQVQVSRLPRDTGIASAAPIDDWRRYAWLSYLAGLFGTASAYLDRILLATFISVNAVGILLVVRQLQDLPQVFNRMLLMVGAPMFSACHARGDKAGRDDLYGLMTDWVVKSSLPLFVFLFVCDRPVLALFGPQFAERGADVLWIFLLGQLINLATGPVGSVAMMSGFERLSVRLVGINTGLAVVLVCALAPTLGLLGVAITSLVTNVFINLSHLWMLRQKAGLRWWNSRFLGWLMPSCVAGTVAYAIVYSGLAMSAIALVGTLIATYGAFILALILQGLREDEKDLLIHLRARLLGAGAQT